MSSLKATQSDGYYIPPDYFEHGEYKKKSLNQFNKNKGHNQYLLRSVVRFEMPYDGFCTSPSCHASVGKGTRFNAHKVHVDDYFTTKIWEFIMNCRACAASKFVIRTNPQVRCFDYCSGIKKKIGECYIGDTKDKFVNEIQRLQKSGNDKGETTCQISEIDKLQQEKIGERKAIVEKDAIEFLMNQSEKTMLDDVKSNSKLRSNYRMHRKEKKRRLGEAYAKGLGMGIELSKSTTTDAKLARCAFKIKSSNLKPHAIEKQKFVTIRTSSIFKNDKDSGLQCLRQDKRKDRKQKR